LYDQWQNRAEFIDVPGGLTGIAGQRREDGLNIKIVAGVQQSRGPHAPGFQSHPGEYESDGNHHDRETRQAVPRRRAAVVVGPDQQRIMPTGPHHAADQSRSSKADILEEFWNQKAAPTDLFAKR
jgi:hypothetical protein